MGHNCCTKQKVKKGLWSPDEDEKLFNFITSHGHPSWSSVPKLAGLQRCGKSCRLRWINYLRPDLKRGGFTAQEERRIIEVHRMLGNKWAQIAKHLPGRTDNEIKNFWNSYIKKKLISQGLDPNTHNLLPVAAKSAHQASSNSSSSSSPSSASTLVFGVDRDQTTPYSKGPVFLPIFHLGDIPTTTTTNNNSQSICFHVPPATEMFHEMAVSNGLWGYGAPGFESKDDVVRIQPAVDGGGVDMLRRRRNEEEDEYNIMEGSFEGSNIMDFDFGEAAATNNAFFGAITNGTAANYCGNYGMWDDVI